jgi:hypothetical protein
VDIEVCPQVIAFNARITSAILKQTGSLLAFHLFFQPLSEMTVIRFQVHAVDGGGVKPLLVA